MCGRTMYRMTFLVHCRILNDAKMNTILLKYDEQSVKAFIIGGESFISDAPINIIKKLAELFDRAYKEAIDEGIQS